MTHLKLQLDLLQELPVLLGHKVQPVLENKVLLV